MEQVNKETMAVYKKHGISPFSSIGTLIIQLPLFIAIYSAVKVAFEGTANLSNMLYTPVKDLSYVEGVLNGTTKAVTTFANWANLALKPFSNNKVYVPVLIIALVSIALQYLQVKQTMPKKKQKEGIEDPNEKLANATPYIMVVLFGWISLSVAGAISFYLGAGALVAIFQQYYLMDKEKKEDVAQESTKPVITVTTEQAEKKKAKVAKSKTETKKTPVNKKSTAKKKTPAKKSGKNKKK